MIHRQGRKSRLFAKISALLFCSALALSCEKKPAFEGAHLAIEPPQADFGTIQSNDPVAFRDITLTLKNQGNDRLNIKDIELPEGFSYTIVPRNSINSGGKAILKITMDKREFSGEVNETAYVVSNDPVQSRAALALTASIVGNASAPLEGGAKGPDIRLDHKSHIFGTLTRSQAVEHAFPFKNVGTDVLKIYYIETTCLCATARATKTELQPGESGEIIAKLEAYKYSGNRPQKTLTVFTNDPDEPSVPLTILAYIVDAVELEPKEVVLPNIRAGQPASAEVNIIQDGARDLVIQQIESSSPLISTDTRPLEGDRKGYVLTVTISPEMPEGSFEESITITTNYSNYTNAKKGRGQGLELYKDYRKLQLPVKGTVKGAISVVPRSVNFGTVSPGESQKRTLIVSGDTPFEIQSVTLTDAAVRASFDSAASATKHEIELHLVPEGPERNIEDTLTISTSEGTLAVAVYATIKAAP